MQRYRVRRDTLGCTYAGYPSDTVEVYLASDADSERIAYGHEYYVEGRRVGRARERRDIIQSIERETACRTWQDALDLIRARGESKPEPRLGTNTPTATATTPKIEYCQECGTALGVVEAKRCECRCHWAPETSTHYESECSCNSNSEPCQPACQYCAEAKQAKIARVKYDGGDPLVYAKLNELIDAWNGGKA
jgi:hypothetical protein